MSLPVEEKYLHKLKELKAKYAAEVLANPPKETEFGFGQVSGEYLGLCRAERLFLEIIGEPDDE